MSQPSFDELNRKAIEALRGGQPGAARTRFQEVERAGGTPHWLALARACHLLDDVQGEERALERQLEADRRDLPALLAMGELKARKSDSRAAHAFFKAALNMAATVKAPPQLTPLLARAEAFVSEAGKAYQAHLEESLKGAGVSTESASPRVRNALDMLLGKRQLYLQQPNMFYFPELPQRAFFEREEFDWVADLERDIPDMVEELQVVLAQDEEFEPYIQGSKGRPLPSNPLLHDPSWGAYYLWQSGERVEDHARHCPKTMEALTKAPMPDIRGRAPQVLYSLLKPGTHIKPHHGMLNTRLICHVPLVIPDHCAIRVGSETRSWTPGELLIFDDSFEHEAWNRSDRNRIVLIFEIWRPEISAKERQELTALFEAINLFPGSDGSDA